MKTTKLTENFSFAALLATHGPEMVPMFAVDAREHIHVFNVKEKLTPQAGWSIISLAPAENQRPAGPSSD